MWQTWPGAPRRSSWSSASDFGWELPTDGGLHESPNQYFYALWTDFFPESFPISLIIQSKTGHPLFVERTELNEQECTTTQMDLVLNVQPRRIMTSSSLLAILP